MPASSPNDPLHFATPPLVEILPFVDDFSRTTRVKTTLVLFCVLATAAIAPYARTEAQTNHVLTTATTPRTTAEQAAELRRVFSDQFGVSGRDPVGHKIGPNAAGKLAAILGPTWHPVDMYKHTLCGTLHHFEFFDGGGDEADWNNFIIPDANFAYLLDDVRPIADPDEIHNCGAPANCMEAEITPDESFYENPWFTKSTGRSVRGGLPICTYGPWVWDNGHGSRPEIHPSELYWWRSNFSPPEADYILMVLQDDSNRFDRPVDYTGTIVRPWSKVPRSAEFRIAFAVNTPVVQVERLRFEIDELDQRHVVTKNDPAARRDSDDGKNHAIQFNGKIVLEVNELQPLDNNIGVRFVEVTRTGSGLNQSLQGYIALTTKVGVDDRGREGYHVIRVRSRIVPIPPPVVSAPGSIVKSDAISENVPQPVLPPTSRPPTATKLVRRSIRFADVDGRPGLVGDAELRALNGEILGRARNVIVLDGGTIEIQTPSGEIVRVGLPANMLAPLVSSRTTLSAGSAPAGWTSFTAAAGGPALRGAPPTGLQLRAARTVEVSVKPFYAPVRDGKPSREDDSAVSEEMNEILARGNETSVRRLFNSNQAIREITWSFAAKSLKSGRTMTVKTASGAEGEIEIQFPPAKPLRSKVNIIFPSASDSELYEVTAQAEVTDALDNKATAARSVWSHSLVGNNQDQLADALLSAAARMKGIKPNKLVTASRLGSLGQEAAAEANPFARCARMVRTFSLRAAEDGVVSISELRQVAALTGLCSAR
jgi:hypothetical protein